MKRVTEENEKLLLEKRELLQRVTDAEEMGSDGLRTATSVQQRCVSVFVFVCSGYFLAWLNSWPWILLALEYD